jgi:hypothetical protein
MLPKPAGHKLVHYKTNRDVQACDVQACERGRSRAPESRLAAGQQKLAVRRLTRLRADGQVGDEQTRLEFSHRVDRRGTTRDACFASHASFASDAYFAIRRPLQIFSGESRSEFVSFHFLAFIVSPNASFARDAVEIVQKEV